MAEFYFDNLAKNLPDAYKKDINSNNYKILEIERQSNNDLRSLLDCIANSLDIDNATGATLDMYGKRFGQPRGKATDAQYKLMIKSKIVRGMSNGSYKEIVDALCFTFNCPIDDVSIIETAPMKVELQNLKLDTVLNAGFETSQIYQLVKSLMPVGVTLEPISLEGTFEFGEGVIVDGKMEISENDYDENKGFAISEADQSIGGYFGAAQGNETSTELPI